jgi:replicative DNA helicase
LPQKDLETIYKYGDSLDEKKKVVLYTGGRTITEIRNIVGNYDQDEHFIVFVDHAGLVSAPGRTSTDRMSNVVKALRAISLTFNCTIFALCQFNRDVGDSKEPALHMLKDSSEIEQSARKVIVLWTNDHKNYTLYTLKNDSGILGVFPVEYDKTTQTITEIERIRQ